MASKGLYNPLKGLVSQIGRTRAVHRTQHARRAISTTNRLSATEPAHEDSISLISPPPSNLTRAAPVVPQHIVPPTVLATIYSFPTMEPLRFASYPSSHLLVPLRRDILHRAVVYEGDMTRSGTASTKWRREINGSTRKIRPQKGTGHARLGDKKSPMLRGGGVAFGPRPRDFATKLNKKVYDLAWRTALSYRYRKGELIVLNDGIDVPEDMPVSWLKEVFQKNGWGNADGRSLLITGSSRAEISGLFEGMDQMGEEGECLPADEVDVKDILSMGRVIMEQSALNYIFAAHQSDLVKHQNGSKPVSLLADVA